jgi:rhamnogalacturonyl hydrolase YesR
VAKKNENIKVSFEKLKSYCEHEQFKGWDPFDGLNSKLFQATPLKNIRFFRLALIQAFKRSPINLRPIFLVKKDYNPKGIGLFLTSYCNLYKIEPKTEYLETINFLANTLIELQTKGFSGPCWGYNFDWQSRAFFLKKGTPTVVATSFNSYALMDAYEITKNQKYLDVAIKSCDFVTKDLKRTAKLHGFIFSYSPFDDTCVYNASFLGSRLLARVYSYTKDENLLKLAQQSILACAEAQREDGAWVYGEIEFQNWVDSFHTGYNLECLSEYQKYTGDNSFSAIIEKGLKYYTENFFLEDGTPKYYDNKTYPVDIHAPAQFVTTLIRLNRFDEFKHIAEKTLLWTIDNMQDEKGFFYYQMKQGKSSKIPYIRWAQAWMMYGMSFYLLEKQK